MAPAAEPAPARYAAFHGSLSTDIGESAGRLRRAGFAGARTQPLRGEDAYLDFSDMDSLSLRVRNTDGRKYLVRLLCLFSVSVDARAGRAHLCNNHTIFYFIFYCFEYTR